MVDNRILGIDLSLNATGICHRDRDGLYTFASTSFTSKIDTYERWDKTLQIVLDFSQNSDTIYIEDYAFGAQGRARSVLCEIGGIIRYALWKENKQIVLIPPTSLKKFVTGKGNVNKSLILKEVYKRWKIDLDDDNIADAFALVKMAECSFGLETATKEQIRVLEKIGLKGVNG